MRKRLLLSIGLIGLPCAAALFFTTRRAAEQASAPVPQVANRKPIVQVPLAMKSDGYVSSQACRKCHVAEYESWHSSYHRTMTQLATEESVLAPFDGHVERAGSLQAVFHRSNEEFRMSLTVNQPGNPFTFEVPIVLTTGSHHMQAFWFAPPNQRERSVSIVPFVYLREGGRWIPRKASFLQPPQEDDLPEHSRWNSTCVSCHATHGVRDFSGTELDTRVAEFGISCEACHGPAERHVRFHESGAATKDSKTEASLINPALLPHDRSAQVCGQCHSLLIIGKDEWNEFTMHGDSYRPGEDLLKSRAVSSALDDSCWPDGVVRVAGREFSSLCESPCYQQGQISCISCHKLHRAKSDPRPVQEWADDQLAQDRLDNQACLQCHSQFSAEKQLAAHTHHAPESTGSNCYNCHMPHTSYALLKAIRNHQISSPDVLTSRAPVRRLNACNLCHMDKPLAWTAGTLQQWYGLSSPELDESEQHTSAMLIWLLQGDAAQRALAAWHMGWKPAQEASGTNWLAPFLAQLLEDPYDAVRYIAVRSLKSLSGYQELNVDFLAEESVRKAVGERVLKEWGSHPPALRTGHREILLDADGSLRSKDVQSLLKERSKRPVKILE